MRHDMCVGRDCSFVRRSSALACWLIKVADKFAAAVLDRPMAYIRDTNTQFESKVVAFSSANYTNAMLGDSVMASANRTP